VQTQAKQQSILKNQSAIAGGFSVSFFKPTKKKDRDCMVLIDAGI
jgi:hypothetical protein